MVTLRHFEPRDAGALTAHQYAGMTREEVVSLIRDWESLEYKGRYFEMFAVVSGGEVVGTVSLYHHSKSAVSVGPEIFPEHRRKGLGREAMLAAMDRARERGYKIAVQQVRTDNAASIALHKSLGFETDGYGYIDKKGNEVYIFLKLL